MLEVRVFAFALLLVSSLFLFHGLVLLIAPQKSLPTYSWGEQPKLELHRKPLLHLGKRFLGLCITVLVGGAFLRPAMKLMLHPTLSESSWGKSPLPSGSARWDLLVLGLFAATIGYYLMLQPGKLVVLMFAADESRLQNRNTRRLWTTYVRVAGVYAIAFSLLVFGQFIKSLR